MQQKIAQKEKEAKEENLRLMAQRAREERSGVVIQPSVTASKVGGSMGGAIAGYGSDSDSEDDSGSEKDSSRRGGSTTPRGQRPRSVGQGSEEEEESEGETEEDKKAAKERAIARQERRKERERELRMNNMGTEQRAKVLAK